MRKSKAIKWGIMTRVICVGAGQSSTKKLNNEVNRRHRYLNYGLLSIASTLKHRGADPIVLHGHFDHPAVTVKHALSLGMQETKLPILISLPSFYAVDWTGLGNLSNSRNRRVRIFALFWEGVGWSVIGQTYSNRWCQRQMK